MKYVIVVCLILVCIITIPVVLVGTSVPYTEPTDFWYPPIYGGGSVWDCRLPSVDSLEDSWGLLEGTVLPENLLTEVWQ